VLLGSQRSGLPEYVVSFMEVEEMVKSGEPVYIVKLNAVNVDSDTNTSDVPGLDQLLQEFSDVLSGLPEGLPPTRAGDHLSKVMGSGTPVSAIHNVSNKLRARSTVSTGTLLA
jgi:hypothetical protein